jgi:hypothetical protein
MEEQLRHLAVKLEACRRKAHRRTLEYVLESAKILARAKAVAGDAFGRWLKEYGHMDHETARRHLRVARFVERNASLTSKIATLSISKTYALSTLDSVTAEKLLTGALRLSRPLENLTDLEFRKEFRARFPFPPKRRTRQHAFRAAHGALCRAHKELHRAGPFARRMTASQRRRILEKVDALSRLRGLWAEPRYRATKS